MPADSAPPRTAHAATETGTGRRLVLYVRDSYPVAVADTVQTVLERCARLETVDVVDDHRVEQWPPRTVAAGAAEDRPSRRDRVATFEEWAADRGYSLAPAFQTETVASSLLDRGDRYEYVSVPLLTLALYDDDDLRGVVPCTSGNRTFTVEDGLAALETDAWDSFPEAPGERANLSPTSEVRRQ